MTLTEKVKSILNVKDSIIYDFGLGIVAVNIGKEYMFVSDVVEDGIVWSQSPDGGFDFTSVDDFVFFATEVIAWRNSR